MTRKFSDRTVFRFICDVFDIVIVAQEFLTLNYTILKFKLYVVDIIICWL